MKRHRMQQRLIAAVALPLLLAVGMAATLALIVSRMAAVQREVADIEATISAINNLEKLIVDAETGFRAFLLVAGDDFLEPTRSADRQLPGRFAELRAAVAGDREQVQRLDALQSTFTGWRRIVDDEIAAKRTGGDYLTLIASRRPKQVVDQMRGTIGQFVARQRALGDAARVRASRFTEIAMVSIGLMAVTLTGVIWFVTWREVKRAVGAYGLALAETSQHRDELRAAAETLEQRVRDRTAALTAANEELEALSYSVSHDLRAPLRHVSGFAELLAAQTKSDTNPKVHHYLDRIIRRTHDAGELIDDLLHFTRTGRSELSIAAVPATSMVREIISSMPDEERRRIEWEIGELPTVAADRHLLRQVFENLIGNAVKYTRGRDVARIRITSEPTAEGDVFTIADNGVGFDDRYEDKLFNVFQRLHSADEFEGTGIGLAIVKRVVRRHGGRVWATSVLGQGAAFSFLLPRRSADAAAATLSGAA